MRLARTTSIVMGLAALSCGAARGADHVEVTTPDGVRLRVEVAGPEGGEPVLLLHGLAASAALNFGAPGIIRALADAGLRVIAPDQRGHGGSAAPADGVYGKRMVADAVAVLDALHVERAHVVGYSMGGLVALALAAEHGDRVRSVLLGGMGWLEAGSRGQRVLGALLGHGEGEPDRPPPAGCAAQLADLALDAEALRRVAAPVEVVIGELDPCRMLVRRLHEERPEWPIQVVPGVGHLRCVLTSELRAAIVAHCRRRADGTTGR